MGIVCRISNSAKVPHRAVPSSPLPRSPYHRSLGASLAATATLNLTASTYSTHTRYHRNHGAIPTQEARSGLFRPHFEHPRPHQAQGLRAARAGEVRLLEVLVAAMRQTLCIKHPASFKCLLMIANRQALRYVIRNTSLPQRTRAQAQLQLSQMHAYTRPTQIKNRCIMGARGKGVFRDFRMARVSSPATEIERERWMLTMANSSNSV